jgi:putative acetyltransferase
MSADKELVIRRVDPASPDCRVLIEELDRVQKSLYPPENNYLDSIEELQKPNCHFLAAYIDEQIVGCGALKIVDENYSELKRMYVGAERYLLSAAGNRREPAGSARSISQKWV